MAEHLAEMDDDEFYYTPEERRLLEQEPTIVEASYHPERDLDLFVLKIGDGRRLVLPRENLQALVGATAEQAADFVVGPHGTDIWWPQVDAGHYLPNLLEGRFGSEAWMEKLQRLGVRLSAGASRQVAAAGEVSSEIGFVFR